MEDARSLSQRLSSRSDEDPDHRPSFYDPNRTPGRGARSGVESVASLGSGLAQHARSLVGSFACSGINERSGGVLAAELAEGREDGRDDRYLRDPEWRDRRRGNGSPRSNGRSHSSHERTTDGTRYQNDLSYSSSKSPTRPRNKTSRSFREVSIVSILWFFTMKASLQFSHSLFGSHMNDSFSTHGHLNGLTSKYIPTLYIAQSSWVSCSFLLGANCQSSLNLFYMLFDFEDCLPV